MDNIFTRTEKLIGADALEKLRNAKVIIFGIGGVGSFTTEALGRAGIGHLVLVDSDRVDITNINRQIEATHDTVGEFKTEAMKKRLLSINPALEVEEYRLFYEKGIEVDLTGADYIVDAIDSIKSKLKLAEAAHIAGIPLVSCMGTGNKLDPTKFQLDDISKTHTCPLCRAMRRGLKELGIGKLDVVWSPEPRPEILKSSPDGRTPASISFVPSVAGLILASKVVRELIEQ